MFIPKKYGQSRIDKCPFCQRQATAVNRQEVPVCQEHKDEFLEGLKCICGSSLDVLKGRYGVFFSCMKCGNMNLRKMLEINTLTPKKKAFIKNDAAQKQSNAHKKTTINVRSDDPRYFD